MIEYPNFIDLNFRFNKNKFADSFNFVQYRSDKLSDVKI